MSDADAPKTKRPIAEIRAELLANKDVQEQAKLLKLPLEQYVEKIIDYGTHPDKPAQLQIRSDEELKQENPKIPTVGEIEGHLQKLISGEVVISAAHQRDGFKNEDKDYENTLGSADALKGKAIEGKGEQMKPVKGTIKP